ncbi:MAG: hypothetical protein K2N63_02580 [Lachnospiraceae bacterium]|nr:hypothetical protein [Lachnospiraceae bacterium]
MLYHVSRTAGLRVLKPAVSTHKKPYVYAIKNLVTGLLFGAKKDDFDFILLSDENNRPIIYECYPDAFELVYKNKGCSIYELAEEGFLRGMTSWSSELVCETEVAVQNEIVVLDLYGRLLEEETKGNIVIHRYSQDMEYKAGIAKHIVDRLIRFNVDLEHCMEWEDIRFRKYYGELIKALNLVMDGHLL